MKTKNMALISILVIVVIAAIATALFMQQNNKEQACTASGGTVQTALCCSSAGDFPNNCLIGACGCSPDNSHNVKVCACPEGKCFDGTACV